jgi:glycosyltransferase involved in cell wall biosynthesis
MTPPPSPKLKILHVIPGLSNASGPTQVVYHLAHQMIDYGHDVTICYVVGRGTDPVYDFDKRIELLGFPAVWFRKWGYSPALRRYLQKNLGQFDIVHVHSLWLYPNIAVMQAATKHKVPYIIRPAGSLEPWALGFSAWKKRLYLALIERHIINGASRVHAASEQEAENIRKLSFLTKIMTITNGIDIQAFQKTSQQQNLRQIFQIPESSFVLLFFGRIHPVKNLEFLVRVTKKLIARYGESVVLAIAGPNQHAYAQKISAQIQKARIESQCRFLGEISADQKSEIYTMGDVFLLPSFSENFAVAVTEALASGLPVVVSKHTPWAEVVTYQSGYWLPLEESAFVEKIELLIQNRGLKQEMSNRAKIHAAQYNWQSITSKVISCYQQIIDERRQNPE